jgi:hypothetical protein
MDDVDNDDDPERASDPHHDVVPDPHQHDDAGRLPSLDRMADAENEAAQERRGDERACQGVQRTNRTPRYAISSVNPAETARM